MNDKEIIELFRIYQYFDNYVIINRISSYLHEVIAGA